MTTDQDGAPRWRQYPTNPAKVFTIDRRAPIPVNAFGHGRKTTYDRLTESEQRKFDAQFAAWRAACVLADTPGETDRFGTQVHNEPIEAWLTARKAWERYR